MDGESFGPIHSSRVLPRPSCSTLRAFPLFTNERFSLRRPSWIGCLTLCGMVLANGRAEPAEVAGSWGRVRKAFPCQRPRFFWLLKSVGSFVIAEAASAKGGTRSAPAGFLYVIRRCGPDAAAGSGFLERWSGK